MSDAVLALDLDGTLIDARRRQVAVARDALLSIAGHNLDEASFWRMKRAGDTTAGAIERLGYPPELALRVSRRWKLEVEDDRWLAHDRALAGVPRALRKLRIEGVRIVVITARSRPRSAHVSLDHAALAPLVEQVLVVDPEGATEAKAQMLRSKSVAAFVGDTEVDGTAARSAGVAFVAVSTGQRNAGKLRSLGFPVASSLSGALASLGM